MAALFPRWTDLRSTAIRLSAAYGLSDEQVAAIKEGEPIYLKGMQNKGRTFDGYLVMDDTLKYGRTFSKEDPRAWVKYGKYEMRLMDKVLIEAGFITRAIVKWWGGMGQTKHPYL